MQGNPIVERHIKRFIASRVAADLSAEWQPASWQDEERGIDAWFIGNDQSRKSVAVRLVDAEIPALKQDAFLAVDLSDLDEDNDSTVLPISLLDLGRILTGCYADLYIVAWFVSKDDATVIKKTVLLDGAKLADLVKEALQDFLSSCRERQEELAALLVATYGDGAGDEDDWE